MDVVLFVRYFGVCGCGSDGMVWVAQHSKIAIDSAFDGRNLYIYSGNVLHAIVTNGGCRWSELAGECWDAWV